MKILLKISSMHTKTVNEGIIKKWLNVLKLNELVQLAKTVNNVWVGQNSRGATMRRRLESRPLPGNARPRTTSQTNKHLSTFIFHSRSRTVKHLKNGGVV